MLLTVSRNFQLYSSIKTYEKYEKILHDNNLENGEVKISMELINDSYKEKLKGGF